MALLLFVLVVHRALRLFAVAAGEPLIMLGNDEMEKLQSTLYFVRSTSISLETQGQLTSLYCVGTGWGPFP